MGAHKPQRSCPVCDDIIQSTGPRWVCCTAWLTATARNGVIPSASNTGTSSTGPPVPVSADPNPTTAPAIPDPAGRGVTLWTSTEVPHLVRTYIARELEIDEHLVEVVAPDVGGGVGVKAPARPRREGLGMVHIVPELLPTPPIR